MKLCVGLHYRFIKHFGEFIRVQYTHKTHSLKVVGLNIYDQYRLLTP